MAASYATPTYADFEIEAGRELVRVRSSPAGEVAARFNLPFSEQDQRLLRGWLENAVRAARSLGGRALLNIPVDRPQEVGVKLFDALFPPEVRSLYDSSRAIVRDRGQGGLRLKLRLFKDVEQLPWELLYDPRDDYLALTPNLSVVRYLDAPVPVRPLQADGPLRVLLVAGSSEGLNLADEIKGVRETTQALVSSGRLAVDVLERASVEAIYERLSRGRYHIVHYLGHGEAPSDDAPARLLLYDDRGDPTPVDIMLLWRTLRRSETLRLIWLNSCEGAVGAAGALTGPLASAAARFVATGVPAVLANQLRISDGAARKLARGFYTNLADGRPVDVALAEARVEVSVAALDSLEWATPVLYMRAADGVLFAPSQSTSGNQMIQSTDAVLGSVSQERASNVTFGDISGSAGTKSPAQSYSLPTSGASDEDADFKQSLIDQRRALRRRLSERQLQAAKYGINTPPEVSIEIEDLSEQIDKLDKRIASL